MGMNTDPYQPVEEDLGQTRLVLEALKREGLPVCILTKSDLALRDIDLIRQMKGSSVGFSVAFTEEEARAAFEKNTIPLEARLDALARLRGAGIETYGLINPVIPHLTRVDELVDLLAPRVDTVWVYPLHMDSREDANWKATRDVLVRRYPDALEDVEGAVFGGGDVWARLRARLMERAASLPVRLEVRL
jgi:DNA repair photolyase